MSVKPSQFEIERCTRLNIGLVSTLRQPGTKIRTRHTGGVTMNESALSMENQ